MKKIIIIAAMVTHSVIGQNLIEQEKINQEQINNVITNFKNLGIDKFEINQIKDATKNKLTLNYIFATELTKKFIDIYDFMKESKKTQILIDIERGKIKKAWLLYILNEQVGFLDLTKKIYFESESWSDWISSDFNELWNW